MQEKMYCQYCGEKERLEINKYNDEYAVHCQHCGSIGPMGKDPEFAILKWNDRIVEALKMLQENLKMLKNEVYLAEDEFCPFLIKYPIHKCRRAGCMMWVSVGEDEGRCGLVNTMFINSTGCGE